MRYRDLTFHCTHKGKQTPFNSYSEHKHCLRNPQALLHLKVGEVGGGDEREKENGKKKKKTLQTRRQGFPAASLLFFVVVVVVCFLGGWYNHVFNPGVEEEKSPCQLTLIPEHTKRPSQSGELFR